MLRHFKSSLLISPVAVYVFFAALMSLSCLLLTPPGQTPDARNHLARVTQIAQGGLIGLKNGAKDAGGYLSTNFPSEPELLNSLRFNPQAKVPMNELLALSQRHWSAERTWVSFPNTVIYAPITYIPGALTVLVAKQTRATIIQTSYAVCAINALCTVLLCVWGIALARRGTLYLILLSSLPMVIALGASCSQDGILIGLSVLTASLLTRLDPLNPGSTRQWVGLALLFAILTVSKPPLILCSLIPLGLRLTGSWRMRTLPFVTSLVAFVLWKKIGLDPTKIQFLDGAGVSDSAQIHWVLTHPLALPALAYHTLHTNLGHNIHEFFGVLGWLDTLFPSIFYRCLYLAIVATCAFCLAPALRHRELHQSGFSVAVTVVAVLAAIGAVYFSLYVIWTPVGAPVIDGVQGRYFLPIAPFLALVFPKLRVEGLVAHTRALHQGAMLVMAAFLTVDMVTLTCVLAARYW